MKRSSLAFAYRILLLSLLLPSIGSAGNLLGNQTDNLTTLEITAKERLNLLLHKDSRFTAARIDNMIINENNGALEILFKCVADTTIQAKQLSEFFKTSFEEEITLGELADAEVKLEVTHIPLSTTIANSLQQVLLTNENVTKYGDFRVSNLSFGIENGITIYLQSVSIKDAPPFNNDIISGLTVLLEEVIFENSAVKDYGGEDRFFNTSINYQPTDQIRSVIRHLFHTTLQPNAIQVLDIEPTETRGVRIYLSQSGDSTGVEFKNHLTKVLRADAKFTNADAMASEVRITKNNVPAIDKQLRPIIHQTEESYLGELYFDEVGNLIVPVFSTQIFSQTDLKKALSDLINEAQANNRLSKSTEGIVDFTLFEVSMKEMLDKFIQDRQMTGAKILSVKYAIDRNLVLNGYCDRLEDLNSIKEFISDVASQEDRVLNFPSDVDYQQVAFYPIRTIPAYLNATNEVDWFLKHIEVLAVKQKDLSSPLIIDIKWYSHFDRQTLLAAFQSSLEIIPEYKPRLQAGIEIGNGLDNSQKLTNELDIAKEIREISSNLRILAKHRKNEKPFNEEDIATTRNLIDKRLKFNPARSAFWFLKAYCEFLVDDSQSTLVQRLLFNVVDIEKRYPQQRSNRGIAVGRLGAEDEFMDILKQIRSKTVKDNRLDLYLKIYKAVE